MFFRGSIRPCDVEMRAYLRGDPPDGAQGARAAIRESQRRGWVRPMVTSEARRSWGRGRWRGLLFRVLAVGLGLLPLAACEAILWAFDLGRPSAHDDPFVGFSTIRPLFERNAEGTRYE